MTQDLAAKRSPIFAFCFFRDLLLHRWLTDIILHFWGSGSEKASQQLQVGSPELVLQSQQGQGWTPAKRRRTGPCLFVTCSSVSNRGQCWPASPLLPFLHLFFLNDIFKLIKHSISLGLLIAVWFRYLLSLLPWDFTILDCSLGWLVFKNVIYWSNLRTELKAPSSEKVFVSPTCLGSLQPLTLKSHPDLVVLEPYS